MAKKHLNISSKSSAVQLGPSILAVNLGAKLAPDLADDFGQIRTLGQPSCVSRTVVKSRPKKPDEIARC